MLFELEFGRGRCLSIGNLVCNSILLRMASTHSRAHEFEFTCSGLFPGLAHLEAIVDDICYFGYPFALNVHFFVMLVNSIEIGCAQQAETDT